MRKIFAMNTSIILAKLYIDVYLAYRTLYILLNDKNISFL